MQRKGKQGRTKHRVDRKQEHCVGAHMLAGGCRVKSNKERVKLYMAERNGRKRAKKKKRHSPTDTNQRRRKISGPGDREGISPLSCGKTMMEQVDVP